MSEKKPFTGGKFLLWVLGFFAVVISVNIVMAYFALGTFSGVVTDDAYSKGRDYNQTLEAAKEQAKLGWQAQFQATSLSESEYALSVTLADKDGVPLDDLTVSLELRRPARQDLDQTVSLARVGAGEYRGVVSLPLQGRWLVHITAQRGETTFLLNDEFMTAVSSQ
ncbi:hypothetical protein GCM10017044_12820 [Kordiimonas sediminis]|uniref:Nitrogen fixation protein FixH n=1 Tax=Kordiimonas sediminis TaxID=1735581 RepID=A0A919AR95_9PROT|nr:FixH family protein [Kordiimonas sediminis]GHF19555.1 hypothetical protein GCM10017044_12820 [Kordiimonas sediminis]